MPVHSLETLKASGNANLYDWNFDGNKDEILRYYFIYYCVDVF